MSPSSDPYLVRLAERLANGLSNMEESRRERHRAFILSCQQDDGGFGGREGDSDLYYTSFAVRALSMLGGMTPHEAKSIGEYLATFDWQKLGVIDLMNWLYTALAVQVFGGGDLLEGEDADWPERIAARLEKVRTPDGGYAKSEEGAAGSTYHSFMVTLTYELLGMTPPRPNRLIQFIYDRQRDDGGFVEIAPMKNSGTNPTAAAVGLMTIVGGLDKELCEDIRDFLKETWSSEGGFQANKRIAFADGLSTFTGLLTVQDLNIKNLASEAMIERFLSHELEFPTGGFRGAAWDDQADVEYSFYGLGCLALLWSKAAT
ncbi:MAG: terpene cyclase/mutase family protein [Planctomycetota bacterium]|nr:terpene cyclase/mutase family protein [Planctomycetota bacterium]MDA0918024.1 terpene cyclase/mutase family protein [Planctomycetota bacterium]MDA1158033.1 terpene cyclase/mutase family protein [Planctomycetota bacterium]